MPLRLLSLTPHMRRSLLLVAIYGLTLGGVFSCRDPQYHDEFANGDFADGKSAFLSSETDPDERTDNSRSHLPEFVMTRELPDVSRRLTNWLNTCWLQAGIKELEISYYRVRRQGKPLSVEHMMMNSLRDRLLRIIEGAPLRTTEFEAGGEMNEARRLAREYGVIPETTWSQAAKPWGDMAKNLKPHSMRLREKYRRRIDANQPVDDIRQEAEDLFSQTLSEHDVHVPKWFMDGSEKLSPQAFAKTFVSENDQDYILILAKSQYPRKLTKKEIDTTQDGYLTTWSNIETSIKDQIDQDRSVLLSIYWSQRAIHINQGVVTVEKDRIEAPSKLVGHVVNIVGYHVNEAGQLDRIKLENTWGRYDGSSGYYSISWKDLKAIYMAISIPDGFSYVHSHDMNGEVLSD